MAYHIGNIEVFFAPATSVDHPLAHYDGMKTGTTTLLAGHQKFPGADTFKVDTIWERDIEVPLRDGTILRGDIFRPKNAEENVPAIIAWSPYGKSGVGIQRIDVLPGRMGVPQSRNCGYEKFEAINPAEWVARGYAVVNMNARGAFDSQGDIRFWGAAEGRDGYDTVEHVARLPWCNGKVAFSGNSWLAVAQWFIAAERPPHLACIAPWEGLCDLYRDVINRGGISAPSFWNYFGKTLAGRNKREDIVAMAEKYPLINEYWEDKMPHLDNIEVPVYVVASSSNVVHTCGTFRAFERIPNDRKWLRVHSTQEWHDLYSTFANDDLQKFFDRYLWDKNNDWETTPKVRISCITFKENNTPYLNFSNWPIPEAKYETFYVTEANQLATELPTESNSLSYRNDTSQGSYGEELEFSFEVTSTTHLIGYSKAVVYVSCDDYDDLDIYVQIRKADKSGALLQHSTVPPADMRALGAEYSQEDNHFQWFGPDGMLRASHRAIDTQRSKSYLPFHPHKAEEKVPQGTVVELTIGIWPAAIVFEPGEKLVFKVAGHSLAPAAILGLKGAFEPANRGTHVLHYGGKYPSRLEVPFVDYTSK